LYSTIYFFHEHTRKKSKQFTAVIWSLTAKLSERIVMVIHSTLWMSHSVLHTKVLSLCHVDITHHDAAKTILLSNKIHYDNFDR